MVEQSGEVAVLRDVIGGLKGGDGDGEGKGKGRVG